MKHLGEADLELFARLLAEEGLGVPEDRRLEIALYLDRVLERNQTLNLTRISDPAEGVRLHLLDSLIALRAVNEAPTGALLDIGTGGGFPGVPLCIASRRPGILLDSVGKKARAVNDVLSQLGLGTLVVAVHERAEDHARAHRAEYAVVTARAVSELPALVELASPLLAEGGRLVALKGDPDDSELERGRQVAALTGMREILTVRSELPLGGERRCIVVYERGGPSRSKLPRRPGEAQKSPLA